MFKSLLFIFFLTFLPDIYKDENYLELIKSIKSHPDKYSFYEKLNIYYSKNYSKLNVNQREEVRQSLIQYGIWSSIRICDQTEAGLQIKLTGKITDENNQPISLARITIFQADSKGYYAPQDATVHTMSEHDPRLYGSIRTEKDGNYTLTTIHPGTYPNVYQGRYIPQHIHFNIVAKGYVNQNLQIAWEDDPAMKDIYWRDWAKETKYPIVKLEETGNTRNAVLNIKLKRVH